MRNVFELYQDIAFLGNCVALSPTLDTYEVARQLEPFEGDWKPYNPAKGDYRRWGLSVTSLDGGLSGMPDLTSVRDYNLQNGTCLDEMAFREFTAVYKACTQLHKIIEPFKGSIGRTHFLKFGTGGFFPYHRDSVGVRENRTFRIFVPLHNHADRDFVFLLEDKVLRLEKGRPYFINTLLEHAVVAFDNESIHLVVNVHLNEESVTTLQKLLFSF